VWLPGPTSVQPLVVLQSCFGQPGLGVTVMTVQGYTSTPCRVGQLVQGWQSNDRAVSVHAADARCRQPAIWTFTELGESLDDEHLGVYDSVLMTEHAASRCLGYKLSMLSHVTVSISAGVLPVESNSE
jgi:hypothetical protein